MQVEYMEVQVQYGSSIMRLMHAHVCMNLCLITLQPSKYKMTSMHVEYGN